MRKIFHSLKWYESCLMLELGSVDVDGQTELANRWRFFWNRARLAF
jgi:hypothetical protein